MKLELELVKKAARQMVMDNIFQTSDVFTKKLESKLNEIFRFKTSVHCIDKDHYTLTVELHGELRQVHLSIRDMPY